MKIKSAQPLSELKSVLMDANSSGPDPAYWVFENITKDKWHNMTVTAPGDYNGEFPKTFGHYHGSDSNETYKLISGQGVLLIQKRKFADDDYVDDLIEKVYFVEFLPGDELIITPEWGHSFINIGNEPLITFDDWNEPHSPSDYEGIKNLRGMSYYLIKKDGKAEFVKNENYKEVPTPQWVSVNDLKGTTESC
ncbi:hypothetical protein KKG08_02660 [Patescibacteria group bacterium]|nr:hypothetical protein [Patescibacteria group bacterium]